MSNHDNSPDWMKEKNMKEEIEKQLNKLKTEKEAKFFPKGMSEEYGEAIELLEKLYQAFNL